MSKHTNPHTAPQRPARLTRRTFLGVVLGALPAAALPGGALAALWPESELDREVDEPWLLALDHETLWDPAGDGAARVPSLRSIIADTHPAILTASGRELDAVIEEYVLDSGYIDEDDDGLHAYVVQQRESLDLGIDRDSADFENWYGQQLNQEAWTTWMQLPEDVRDRLNVHLVEGDQPGSNLTYIRYAGKLDDLNRDLIAAGLNIVVIEQEPCYDLLSPGDPGY